MRPIHVVQVDKRRPAVVLTREAVRPHLRRVTVAAITTRIRGVKSEVAVGPENGLEGRAVITCDNIATIEVGALGPPIGRLLDDQEEALAAALVAAFDLRV